MRYAPALIVLVLLCAPCVAEDAPAPSFSDDELAFFETKIRPVLAEHCYSCHSHESKKLKGGFYLDSRGHILDDGLAEVGEPDESFIIEAVRYKNPKMQMPPQGKLPDAVIKDLEKWVKMGLPWPEEAGPEGAEKFDLEARQKAHWAWKTPNKSKALPKVVGLDGSAGFIDRFLEARLAVEGVKPSPLADRTTLIRRVTLDLTGLPPTPAEVDAFVNDKSPDAYERLVDRLLASPRYGEKWARHWLDLVRYAESYGHEFDFTIPEAWKYRDYVIRAINDDIAYDRWVKEHIAGDLITPRIHEETKVNEAVVATGWWYLHEQTHAPTDVRQHESDRIDNQIDVLSKTFLGVTVACARCHDHKFDAISDEDYYAMAGYLQSSRQQLAYLDPDRRVGKALEKVGALRGDGQAAFEALNAKPLKPTQFKHDASRVFADFNKGDKQGWRTTGWAWGDGPTVAGQWDTRSGKASPVLPGVMHSGLLGDEAMGTLRSPEFDYQDTHIWLRVYGKAQVRLVIDSFTVNQFNALLFKGFDLKIDTKGKWQWIAITGDHRFYVKTGNHRAHLEILDDHRDGHFIIDEVRMGTGGAPPNPDTLALLASVAPKHDPVFAKFTKQLIDAAAKTPSPQRAIAMTDGSGEDSYVHLRGGWKGKGETMPRRLLTALGGEKMPRPTQGSGRDDFANAIVDPSNPLTARVQVNRLWHHLFGRGLVSTVDNFGYLGQLPSHPELLDHLAVTFVEDDAWSNKAMIKRIVMSRAYRRTSDKADQATELKDPQNLLLHRQNIRRIDAEAIRDSILAVAGSLNEQRFGPPVPAYLTEYMQGRGRPKAGPLDGQGRRSIYISVRRNFLPQMMLTFDTPTPFSTVGRRNVSNVPAQSLVLMNDPFVHDQADKWAQRVVKDGSTSAAQRIDAMFRSAIGRAPTPAETKAASAYLDARFEQHGLTAAKALNDVRPWRELCHAMFNLKGFIYVR